MENGTFGQEQPPPPRYIRRFPLDKTQETYLHAVLYDGLQGGDDLERRVGDGGRKGHDVAGAGNPQVVTLEE